MTIKPASILTTLVLAGLALQPLTAAAQSSRTTPVPVPAPRTAPAPAPRQATAPAPAGTTTTAPAPATVGTSGSATPAAPAPSAATVTGIRPWNEAEYRLGPGDKLRVEVYGEPQLSQTLQVRPDGKITQTLVGDVMAAGRTSLELRESLATALKAYMNTPAVTVIVTDAIANQIDVAGEVAHPGQQVLNGPINVLQAVSRAGGVTEWAKKGDIYILRTTPKGTQRIDANYKDALTGKVPAVVLQPGDTLVVP
jgi:polysaccharide biosynthesis/export protein